MWSFTCRRIWHMVSQKATWSSSPWCKRFTYHFGFVPLLSYLIPLCFGPQAAYTVGGHSYTAAAMEYVILKMKPPTHRPQIVYKLILIFIVLLYVFFLESVSIYSIFWCVGTASCYSQAESIRRTTQSKHWYSWTSSCLCLKLWNVLFPCGK